MTLLLTYLYNYFMCKNTEKVNPVTTPIAKIDSIFETVPLSSQLSSHETHQEIQTTIASTIITECNGVKMPDMIKSSIKDNKEHEEEYNETTDYIMTERISRNNFTNNNGIMNSNNYIEYIKIYAIELLDNMTDDFISHISFHEAHSNYIPRLQYYRMYLQTDIDSVFDGTIRPTKIYIRTLKGADINFVGNSLKDYKPQVRFVIFNGINVWMILY